MKFAYKFGFPKLVIGFMGAAVLLSGCGAEEELSSEPAVPVTNTVVDDHSGWWCNAHGIPEDQCSMCSAKAAKEFKANGDWCEEHNRAESQCFKCDASRADKFANLYEAKYGKQPPAITP
jgi:hypothetical protein|tara:strand:+ start:1284 stop:1643 length:360 start_codon:yes stop_codon:yes gene_type:complete